VANHVMQKQEKGNGKITLYNSTTNP